MRVKDFNATGQPTDGRLYAQDLDLIQDSYAAKMDFTQVIGLGTLKIGEDTLELLKFGAGEAILSGALRTNGIVRGLGGLLAGSFTTALRDALPTGSAPYGIVILNTDTNNYEWNSGTDTSRVWKALGTVPLALIGTEGAKPSAASASHEFYLSTDLNGGTLWLSDGSAWLRTAPGLLEVPPQAVKVLDRSYPTVNVTGVTTETTLYTFTIPGGSMAADSILRLFMSFNLKYLSSGTTITFRLKYGGQTLTSILPNTLGPPAISPFGMSLNAFVQNKGSVSSQEMWGYFVPELPLTTFQGITAIAVDTTVNQTLSVTVQLGSASSNYAVEKRLARLELG